MPLPFCSATFVLPCLLPFTTDEVRDQLDQAGLGHFTVTEIGDRYLEVCGQM